MWLIKIVKNIQPNIYSATWQDKPTTILFSRQSSDSPTVGRLLVGTPITIDATATKEQMLPDAEYIVSGSIINFTKKDPPELVICLTTIHSEIKK